VEAQSEGGHDLIIPVYLDPTALLDVFASLEGGFSTAEDVRISDTATNTSRRSIGADIGAWFVTFLKFGAEAEAEKSQAAESAVERSLSKYHTYGSLLHKLRSLLFEKKMVKSPEEGIPATTSFDWTKIQPSDFIEIRGTFQPVPLIEVIEGIDKLMDVILPSAEFTIKDGLQKIENEKTTRLSELEREWARKHTPKQEQKQQRQDLDKACSVLIEQLKNEAEKGIQNLNDIRNILNKIGENLEQGGARAFLVDIDNEECTALIPFYKEYSRDGSLNELTYKKLRILGKVVRNVTGENGKIDLLQGSSLRLLPDNLLNPLLEAIERIGQPQTSKIDESTPAEPQPQLQLPKMRRYVEAPVLEIFPIAVYI
jgi:hypothetical protein